MATPRGAGGRGRGARSTASWEVVRLGCSGEARTLVLVRRARRAVRGATETRFARDLPDVVSWIRDGGPEPLTVYDAAFAPARLLTLRNRNSAAYKGVYALLLCDGARDWMTGEASSIQTYFDESIDIHHIFPQKWCGEHGIEPARCDSIVNKTPLTARTNRSIGGSAPGEYLAGITSKDVPRDVLDSHLHSHIIEPAHLWSNDFDQHFGLASQRSSIQSGWSWGSRSGPMSSRRQMTRPPSMSSCRSTVFCRTTGLSAVRPPAPRCFLMLSLGQPLTAPRPGRPAGLGGVKH